MMDGYKLFGLPKDFGIERWAGLKRQLEYKRQMDVEIFIPPRDQREPLLTLMAEIEEAIRMRLYQETEDEFAVTYIEPQPKNFFRFRIKSVKFK